MMSDFKCAHCGEAIRDEMCFDIDGERYHEHCIDEILSAIEDDTVRWAARYWMDDYKTFTGERGTTYGMD